MRYIYGVYRGDDFIDTGTLDELAVRLNKKASTLYFYSTNTYHNRRKNSNKSLVLFKIDSSLDHKIYRSEKNMPSHNTYQVINSIDEILKVNPGKDEVFYYTKCLSPNGNVSSIEARLFFINEILDNTNRNYRLQEYDLNKVVIKKLPLGAIS